MNKWTAKYGYYEYIIEETEGRFDLNIDFLGQNTSLWFGSYAAARNHLTNYYHFSGRMKKVVSN